MSYKEKQSIEHRIKSLLEKAEQLEDDELKSEIAKYLCILSSGFIEASCRDIVNRYVEKRADPHVVKHIKQQMKQFQNPKMEKILQLIGSFDIAKRHYFDDNIDQGLKDAIISIVSDRHQLAHGVDVGISLARIKDYFNRTKELMKKIENEFCY